MDKKVEVPTDCMKAYAVAMAVGGLSDKKKLKLLRKLQKCMGDPTKGDTTRFDGNLAYCAEKFGTLSNPKAAALYEPQYSYDGKTVLVCPLGYESYKDEAPEGSGCDRDAASWDPLDDLDWRHMQLLY